MTTLALINDQTMICENVSTDPKSASEIQIPGYIVLDLDITPAIDWVWNENAQEWEAIEGIGNGGIGDNYENGKLVQPKPQSLAQPTSTGTQNL